MVKLSPSRFYVEISWNFDITCKSGRPTVCIEQFFKFPVFFFRIWKKSPLFGKYLSENYLLLGNFFSKLAHTKIKLKLEHFSQPRTRNMIFLRTHEKISEKKNFSRKSINFEILIKLCNIIVSFEPIERRTSIWAIFDFIGQTCVTHWPGIPNTIAAPTL